MLVNTKKLYGKGTGIANPYDGIVEEELELRQCHHCGEWKPVLTGFSLNPFRKSGYRRLCRNCNSKLAGVINHRERKGGNISPEYREQLIYDAYGCCQDCGSKKSLQIHHLVPVVLGGHPTDRKNLRVLCKHCHSLRHSKPGMRVDDLAKLQLKKHGNDRVSIVKYDPDSGKIAPFKIGNPEPFPWQFKNK